MSWRPDRLDEIWGQDQVVDSLKIAIKSANIRDSALPHLLLSSQPGLGKTSMAKVIARELGTKMHVVLGSNIDSFKDILPSIVGIGRREILFIDEIHRVNKRIAESFYTILEDFRIDIPMEEDGEMRAVNIDLPEFTVIGATTHAGLLATPFLDRFKLKFSLELYSIDCLTDILVVNARKMDIMIPESVLRIIAKASRGTPRIANGLLEWIRDYGIAHALKVITGRHVRHAMEMRGIGEDGSTPDDRRYLDLLKNRKKPVGLDSICSSLNITKETITSIIEPWLLQQGLICKVPRGRELINE